MSGSARVLCEGIYFGEGPRWRDSRLWFSDFYAKAVKSASLAGDVRTEFVIDDLPSGLGWMPDGSMLIVSMTSRRVLRRSPDGAVRVHAELADIATFHCNDMVVDAAGRAYVGNFGFDLHRELAARGDQSVLADHPTATLARVSPEGVAAVAAADLHFPNGTVITPDGKNPHRGRDARRPTHGVRHRAGRGAQQPARLGVDLPPVFRTGLRSTPRAPSGSPMRSRPKACASPRAARCWRRSQPARTVSPACSAATTARRSS